MAVPVNHLKGIDQNTAKALQGLGVKDSDQMLASAATPAGRKDLAAKVGVDVRAILELANRADLARVRGIAGVYSDLLERAGVDTVKELATRRPDNLHKKILQTNEAERITARAPTAEMIEDWVTQAKELPKVLEY
jgi:predicted flap endonuclease-1-like 5' DNA nuclease